VDNRLAELLGFDGLVVNSSAPTGSRRPTPMVESVRINGAMLAGDVRTVR